MGETWVGTGCMTMAVPRNRSVHEPFVLNGAEKNLREPELRGSAGKRGVVRDIVRPRAGRNADAGSDGMAPCRDRRLPAVREPTERGQRCLDLDRRRSSGGT